MSCNQLISIKPFFFGCAPSLLTEHKLCMLAPPCLHGNKSNSFCLAYRLRGSKHPSQSLPRPWVIFNLYLRWHRNSLETDEQTLRFTTLTELYSFQKQESLTDDKNSQWGDPIYCWSMDTEWNVSGLVYSRLESCQMVWKVEWTFRYFLCD